MINRKLLVTYDIIPVQSMGADGINFDVQTWTLIPYLANRTGFTTNMAVFQPSPNGAKIDFAIVRCAFQASQSQTSVIQIAGYYYDNKGNPIWDYPWGEFTKRPQYNPDNQGIDITAKLTNLLSLPSISSPCVTVRVKGKGVLQEARIEVGYLIPDFTDDIAALQARVTELENKSTV